MKWGDGMTNFQGRKNPLILRGEYEIKWRDFSNIGLKNGIFRYSLISVDLI